jgi:hypothetical protein
MVLVVATVTARSSGATCPVPDHGVDNITPDKKSP